ncbi:hypothetical protein BP5796_07574 [Coleophoma crateriformis]|uniref:Uncharacterized protein n=1 Tax=Coleophoma crateriformis TaxID=565419 RepID=A0A3D8RJB5_9HELO|nr:hypothetical protein BP5796_07574 [Coleophoma crateriformis]
MAPVLNLLGDNMMPSVDDLAIAAFIHDHVIGMDYNGETRGHMDGFVDIQRLQNLDTNLIHAMKAIGLASFSHFQKSPLLMRDAQKHYLHAIQYTNAAIRDPVDVKKDSTLTSIMMLGIFETMTGTNPKSLEAYQNHFNGAAAVVKLRGREQLATPAGRRMFIQVTTNLIMICMQREVPLPEHILKLTEEVNRTMPAMLRESSGWRVQQAMIAYAQLRADIRVKKTSDPLEILQKVIELDGILLDIFERTPEGWHYTTIYTDSDPEVVWNGKYHLYYDYWIANIWNGMRTTRILLNTTMRSILLDGFSAKPPTFTSPEYTAQYQISTDTVYQLQADILASVPQHMGYVEKFQSPKLAYDASRPSNPESIEKALSNFHFSIVSDEQRRAAKSCSPMPAIRASGGYFIMWPLWFVGIMGFASEEVREYSIRNLESLGNNMGIRHALLLADIVRLRNTTGKYDDDRLFQKPKVQKPQATPTVLAPAVAAN